MKQFWIPDGMERAYLALLRRNAEAPRLTPAPKPGAMCEVSWCLAHADNASYTDIVTVRLHVKNLTTGVYEMDAREERVPVRCAVHRQHPSFKPGKFRGRNPWTLKANVPPALWRRAS